MATPIVSIPPPTSIEQIAVGGVAGGAKAADPNAFAAVFADAVQRVENYQASAGQAVEKFLSGQDEEIHKVALSAQQAELSFDLFLQVKNKVVNAYQEIMRMQL